VAGWGELDMLGMMEQLGAMPMLGWATLPVAGRPSGAKGAMGCPTTQDRAAGRTSGSCCASCRPSTRRTKMLPCR
jgi:hypothetical protein